MDIANVNGKAIQLSNSMLSLSNRSYRFGDGLFETMYMRRGNLRLYPYHMERLFNCLHLLKYKVPSSFTAEKIFQEAKTICQANNAIEQGRVRITVSRGDGNLYELDQFQYSIEAWTYEESNRVGKVNINSYTDIKKAPGVYSTIKSCNYLPSVMGVLYAHENGCDDVLLYNTNGHIIETTISNVFLAKGDMVFTPPLKDGCVNGVMRRHVIELLKQNENFLLQEVSITENDVENADEIILTNAMGLRYVNHFKDKKYQHRLFDQLNNYLLHAE